MICPPSNQHIQNAIDQLNNGDLIGLPTETVYGLAADATNDLAVAKIFERKKRPRFNPLIIHSHSIQSLKDHVIWSKTAEVLAQTFWPGPLTLVLPKLKDSSISLLCSAGMDTLAVRIPNHPVSLEILQRFDKPLAAPSANPSGRISPTHAEHVHQDYPDLLVLDGGACSVGIESTIIDLTNESPQLLRPGMITRHEVEALIGPLSTATSDAVKAPGMLKSHYAPEHSVKLNVNNPKEGEAYLAFGPTHITGDFVLNLSPTGQLTEAAANLFTMLRKLDASSCTGIAVAPIPNEGLGLAINDRLKRAAAPRDT